MSRRQRAVLISLSLIGTALLIWLDHRVLAPMWSIRPAAGPRAFEADMARYHGRAFRVARIVDGDTLHLIAPDGRHATTKVRLLGIDAPEMAGDNASPAYYARAATVCAERLALDKSVTAYLDEEAGGRGRYGRLLAYIELPDGTLLNEQLLLEGCAYADLRFPHSYYHKYRQLEASARALHEGLWADVKPEQMPPWRQRMAGD